MFSLRNLFYTCIALRLLNSGFFFNFNQSNKWLGILNCYSLRKGVFSFPINEWIGSWISLACSPFMVRRWVVKRSKEVDWFPLHTLIGESWSHGLLSARKMKTKNEAAVQGEVGDAEKNWLRMVSLRGGTETGPGRRLKSSLNETHQRWPRKSYALPSVYKTKRQKANSRENITWSEYTN